MRTFGSTRVAAVLVCVAMMGTLGASEQLAPPAGPKHSAALKFQVLPAEGTGPTGDPQEIMRFINRQVLFVKSGALVDRVLEAKDFQNEPGGGKSRWFTANEKQARKKLAEDLVVEAIPNSDLFTIWFTTDNAEESARLVNVIGRVYLETLRMDARVQTAQRLEDLRKTVTAQEGEVRRTEGMLSDFRKAHNLDALLLSQPVTLQVVAQLEVDLVKAQTKAAAATGNLETIRKQLQTGTLVMPLEMEQYVENDAKVRMLEQAKLQLDLEEAQGSGDAKGIKARMAVVEKQLKARREEMQISATTRLQEHAMAENTRAAAEVQVLKKARDGKAMELMDMSVWMSHAQQMADANKAQQDILTELRKQFTMEQLKSLTDDARVRRFGGDARAAE